MVILPIFENFRVGDVDYSESYLVYGVGYTAFIIKFPIEL